MMPEDSGAVVRGLCSLVRSRQRTVVALLFLGGVGLFGPPTVRAHAFLDHAEPRVGSTVSAAPVAVSLTFTEPVEPGFCRVEVRDVRGEKIAATALEHPKPEQLRLPLPSLPPGTYAVHWTVTSVDTHQTAGSYEFTVSP